VSKGGRGIEAVIRYSPSSVPIAKRFYTQRRTNEFARDSYRRRHGDRNAARKLDDARERNAQRNAWKDED
jgi:hypothetical protein